VTDRLIRITGAGGQASRTVAESSSSMITGCRWVIALPRLGAEYIADFVIARLAELSF
jgi:hypothetical protein